MKQWFIIRPILAFQKLTCISIPLKQPFSPAEHGKCAVAFPLVGLVIGCASWLIWWAVGWATGYVWLAALASMITETLLTGALHVDGLSHTADGVFSQHHPERILKIIHRTSINTMGIVSLFFVMFAKWILLVQLGSREIPTQMFLIVPPILARLSMVSCAVLGKDIGKDEQKLAIDEVRGFEWIIAALLAALITLPLMSIYTVICLPAAVLCGAITCHYCSKKLGGITHEILGASNELGHVTVLLAFTLALRLIDMLL